MVIYLHLRVRCYFWSTMGIFLEIYVRRHYLPCTRLVLVELYSMSTTFVVPIYILIIRVLRTEPRQRRWWAKSFEILGPQLWDAIPSWPRLATEFPIYWSSDEAIPFFKKKILWGDSWLPLPPVFSYLHPSTRRWRPVLVVRGVRVLGSGLDFRGILISRMGRHGRGRGVTR